MKAYPSIAWGCVLPILLLVLLAQSCSPAKAPKAHTNVSQPMSRYYYTDALNNDYIFHADSLKYVPIKPHLSSSGMADGGEPQEIGLSYAQFEKLEGLFRTAFSDKDNYLKTRLMGCGTLTLEEGKKSTTIFLKMSAPSKEALESALKQCLR